MVDLLKLRSEIKKKKPLFLRSNAHVFKRLRKRWKKPTGKTNKVRREESGKRKRPKIGYSSPSAVRGAHRRGLYEVLVYNPKDLLKIDKETQGARIAHSVGRRKRIEIQKKADKIGIHVFNRIKLSNTDNISEAGDNNES